MSLYKKNILFIVIFTLCALGSVPAFVWLVDPFHIYHRDTWINRGKTIGGGIESLKNGAIVRSGYLNGGIDGVFAGGCVSNGVNISDFKRAVQGKKNFVHLYTTSVNFNPSHIEMLQWMLKKKDLRHVFILNPLAIFSPRSFRGGCDLFYHPERSLFMKSGIFSAIAMVLSHFQFLKRPLRPPEKRHLWQPEDPKEFFKHAMKSRNKGVISSVIIDDKFQNKTDNPLLQLIAEHPEVTFYLLFFPQWSLNDKNAVKMNLKDTSFYIENTKTFPNVKIYDFRDVPHTVIATNWGDGVHFFSPMFCKFMAYCIEHSLHTITAKNYDAYKKHILDVLKSFNLSDYPDRSTSFEELVAYEESLHPELKKQKAEEGVANQ